MEAGTRNGLPSQQRSIMLLRSLSLRSEPTTRTLVTSSLAAGQDPLDMAEGAVDGRGPVTMADEGLLHFSWPSRISQPGYRSRSLCLAASMSFASIKMLPTIPLVLVLILKTNLRLAA